MPNTKSQAPMSAGPSPTTHSSDKSHSRAPTFDMASPVHADSAESVNSSKRRTTVSSQTTRRRAYWHGKICYISVPIDDNRGKRHLLTKTEVGRKLDDWNSKGWDTNGFQITNSPNFSGSSSQTCGEFPANIDVQTERRDRKYRVGIPNQEEWDAYVNFLKEEKLRALGVTSSDSEPSRSIQSPFPSTASHASPRMPGRSMSPASSSAASTLPHQNSRPFSPAFLESNGSPRIGSINSLSGSSPFPHVARHNSSKSVAYPMISPRMTPPFNMQPLRAASPLQSEFMGSQYRPRAQDRFSPSLLADVQSVGQVLSPHLQNNGQLHTSTADNRPRRGSNPSFPSIYQAGRTDQGTDTSKPAPSTPRLENQNIMHPSPHGHQRNISEALQREIDAAEEELESSIGHGEDFMPQNDLSLARKSEETDIAQSGKALPPKGETVKESPHKALSELPVNVPQDLSKQNGLPPVTAQPASNDLSPQTGAKTSPWSEDRDNANSQSEMKLKGHGPKLSISKLNVEAAEFKFNPRNQVAFSFNSNPSAYKPSPSNTLAPNSNASTPKSNLANLAKLNADAPSFTPSQPQKSDFQFSSASFNVNAPVFNPSKPAQDGTVTKLADARDISGSASPENKIFDAVPADSLMKATRRAKASKPLPLRKASPQVEPEDDENGRPQASAARQKRPRVKNLGDHEMGLFAIATGWTIDNPTENEASPEALSDESKRAVDHAMASVKVGHNQIIEKDSVPTTPAQEEEPQLATIASVVETEKVATAETLPQKGIQATIDRMKHPVRNHTPDLMSFDSEESSKPLTLAKLTKPIPKVEGLEASRWATTPPSSPPAQDRSAGHHISPPAKDLLLAAEDQTPQDQKASHLRRTEEESIDSIDDLVEGRSSSVASKSVDSSRAPSLSSPVVSGSDKLDGADPSYDEIDAVMRQLQDDPDLGIERIDTPPASFESAQVRSLDPSTQVRSDAPSPSPGRVQNTEDANSQIISAGNSLIPSPDIRTDTHQLTDQQLVRTDDENRTLHATVEKKYGPISQGAFSQAQILVDVILEDRLRPLTGMIAGVTDSLEQLRETAAAGQQSNSDHRLLDVADEIKHSDADDEDEDEESRFSDLNSRQGRLPQSQRRDRKMDVVKSAMMEVLEQYQLDNDQNRLMNDSALDSLTREVKLLREGSNSRQNPEDIKTIVEEVISTHPRLRGKRVQDDHAASSSNKFQMKIDGLESMLRVAHERADDECSGRRKVEDELAEVERQLNIVGEEAAQYREAAEETESMLREFHEEKESARHLANINSDLTLKNAALETTLEEYRLSHDQWRLDIQDSNRVNGDLKSVLKSLKREVDESTESKQLLRVKIERMQDQLSNAVSSIADDQASWLRKELTLTSERRVLIHEVEQANNHFDKTRLEVEGLKQELAVNLKIKDAHALAEAENIRLEMLVASLRQDIRKHEDAFFHSERELKQHREESQSQISRAQSNHEHDMGLLQGQHESARTGLESQISLLESQLQQVRLDTDDARAIHDQQLEEAADRHDQALHEVKEDREAAVADQRRSHERALNDLRERHARALHNSSDDKHRLEANFAEKSALSDDKVQHLEGKVADLLERLEIASSAARAAAKAATERGAPESEVRVPIQAAVSTSASMSLGEGSNVPEKISPQALRESIMVLQDQLQQREQTIESLEGELAAVDKEAPTKIKDRDTEISWLRELLGVRINELGDIIRALSEDNYDREAVKNAVIRLKANIQMEQQEKERAASGSSGILPSISSLSSITSTPRALPMAAAAAWGQWRKARDSSLGMLAESPQSQTPSRSVSSSSAQSFLSGLLTPPPVNQREPGSMSSAPPTMMNLNGRKTSSQARPLRASSTQRAQAMSARQAEKRPLRRSNSPARAPSFREVERSTPSETPKTPPLMRSGSYDRDADARRSILSDLDDDASPIGSGHDGGDSSIGEPFESSAP